MALNYQSFFCLSVNCNWISKNCDPLNSHLTLWDCIGKFYITNRTLTCRFFTQSILLEWYFILKEQRRKEVLLWLHYLYLSADSSSQRINECFMSLIFTHVFSYSFSWNANDLLTAINNHPMAVRWQEKKVCQPSEPYYLKLLQNIAFLISMNWITDMFKFFIVLGLLIQHFYFW